MNLSAPGILASGLPAGSARLPRRGRVLPLPPRPAGAWRCPVAGCCFAAIYPIDHPCPLAPAAGAPGAPAAPADPADPADPFTLGRALAGLRGLSGALSARAEPTAEDFGTALEAWGPAADAVRVLPHPMAGVGA